MNADGGQRRDWLGIGLRLFLGGFYVLAGCLKIAEPGKFAEAVANYRLLPYELINLVAITLPGIEIVAGGFLMLGLWTRASAWLINVMTVVFIAAITSAVIRGLNVECGCFGTVGGRRVGLTAIAEDLVLLVCGWWILKRFARTAVDTTAPEVSLPSPSQG
jgi:putative oxidoreductase